MLRSPINNTSSTELFACTLEVSNKPVNLDYRYNSTHTRLTRELLLLAPPVPWTIALPRFLLQVIQLSCIAPLVRNVDHQRHLAILSPLPMESPLIYLEKKT